jgi:hypothetical protein
MDSADTQARLDKLTTEADSLVEAVHALNVTADRIAKRTRRSEAVLVALVISFLLDVTLTVIVTIGLTQLSDTTRTVQETQANGRVVRQQVLCPLYQLIVTSYSTQVRDNPVLNPRGPAWYDNAYATLRNGNQALHCAP